MEEYQSSSNDPNVKKAPMALNRLPLLSESLVPGSVNDLDLSSKIRTLLRDLLQQDVQIHQTFDRQIVEEYKRSTEGVRHAERELMELHGDLLSKRDLSGARALPKGDISRTLADRYNLIRIRKTYTDAINSRTVHTGVRVTRTGHLVMDEHPDPSGCEHLINGKMFPRTHFTDILATKDEARSLHRLKQDLKVEFTVKPKEIIFKKFVVGKSFNAKLIVQNVSRNSAEFRLIMPKNQIFTISSGVKARELAPGLSSLFIITFHCQDKDDHYENITVLVRGGSTITVPIRAVQEPPILKTDSIYLLSKINSPSLVGLQESSNLVDCERCLVGDSKHLSVLVYNDGPLARFFILSELSWTFKTIQDVTNDNIILIPPFSLRPAFISLDTNEDVRLDVVFRPECEGSHVTRLYIVCDNITVRTLDLVGESTAYRPDYFIFQNLEKMYDVFIEDNMGAEYCLYLGKCYRNNLVKSQFKIENKNITEMKFRWTMKEPNIKGVFPIPCENIGLSPSSGIFCQFGIITFSVIFIGSKLSLGRYASVITIHIDDLPKESIPTDLRHTNLFTEVNDRVSVALASVELWVDVVEPVVTLFQNYISMDAVPNVTTKTSVPISNFGLSTANIIWDVPRVDHCLITITPEKFNMPILSSRKFNLTFCSDKIGYYSIIIRGTVKFTDIIFQVKLDAEVKIFVSKGGYTPLDCGIVRIGDYYEGGLEVMVATPIYAETEMDEYISTYNKEGNEILLKTKNMILNKYPLAVIPGGNDSIQFTLNTNNEQICYNILDWQIWEEHFFVEILGDVQMSDASFDLSTYVFNRCLFIGKEETISVRIRNHTLMSTKFKLQKPFGPDNEFCTLTYSNNVGTLLPSSEEDITIILTPQSSGVIRDLYIPCTVEGMLSPLILQIIALIKDREVKFSWAAEEGGLVTKVWPEEEFNPLHPVFPSETDNSEDNSKTCICYTDVQSSSLESSSSTDNMEYKIMHYADSSESSVPYEKWPIIGGRYYGAVFTDENMKKNFEEPWLNETIHEKCKEMQKEEKEKVISFFSKRALCFQINAFQEASKTVEICNLTPAVCAYKTKAGFFRTKANSKQLDPFTEAELLFYSTTKLGTSSELIRKTWTSMIQDNLGLGIITKEKQGYLKGFETVVVKVLVFGIAWGTYFDTITINIESLPTFHIPIFVNVVQNPVHFVFSPNEMSPIQRFSAFLPWSIRKKTVVLKNNTFLPLKVTWTTFILPQPDRREARLLLPKRTDPDFGIMLDLQPKSELDFCKIHITTYVGRQESTMYRVSPTVVRLPPYGKVSMKITADTTRCWYNENYTTYIMKGTAVGVVYIDNESRNIKDKEGKTINENVACYRPDGFEIDQITLRLETKMEVSLIRIVNRTLEDSIFRVYTTNIFSNSNKIFRERRTYLLKNFGDGKAHLSLCVAHPFIISSVRSKENGDLPLGREYSLESKGVIEVEVTLILTGDSIFELCETGCSFLHNNEAIERNLICKLRDYSEQIFTLYLEILKPSLKISNNELDFGDVNLHASKTHSITVISYNGDEPYIVRFRRKMDEDIFKFSQTTGIFKAKEKVSMYITFSPRECTRYAVIVEFVTTTPGYVVPLTLMGTGTIDQRSNI